MTVYNYNEINEYYDENTYYKCSLACKGSPTTQAYLNGSIYIYIVEANVTIYVTGASSNEHTSVKLLGQVSVFPLGNCVYELAVEKLDIFGPDGKKYQSPPGTEKPVLFTLQDGRIGAEICAEEGDTRRSLNIKRGIISLLQTEQKTSTQIDIFGTCPTEVSSSQEGGAILVHRSRDLSRCGHREQGKNGLITGVFNVGAEIKDTQVLRSILNVETKVNDGVPEKVASSEEYLYRPFSVGENGARAKVHTKLTLTNKARAAAAANHCTVSRTIIFEAPHGTANKNNFQSALTAVKETARMLATEASSKSAASFAQLVRIMRASSRDDLLRVHMQVKDNHIEKRVFLDGLFRTGSGYSVEASIQLLKSKELGFVEERLAFLSFANAKHISNEAVRAAADVLDLPNLPKEVYLGVGALAGAFCREHECHKVKNDGVVALSYKFAAKLWNCRPRTKLEEDTVLAVLKGIRNIRHLEDNLIEKMSYCALDNNVKPRVKVAALEAFLADPCAAKLKKTATDILRNRQLDSEIRIKAYLAIIGCPCARSALDIKSLLASEPVNQVGNFITTSLRNIRSSANPDKQLARQHYGLIRTPSKFKNDIRKYSSSEEESYNVDALGLGGNIEKNVIYSQDSFIPRSVSVNLTAEVFGHSLNVLEVGGRQGNLDRVIEHLIGPKGLFRTEDLQTFYKKHIIDPLFEYQQKAKSSISRGRRSVKTDVDNFDKILRAESAPYNSELDLDLYIKLFGTDAVFLSLGDGKGFELDKIIDQLLQYVNNGIDQVKHFEQVVRAHLLFLDAELAYPTATGLPLKLDLIGAATGHFEAATVIDIRQIIQNPQNAKIDVKLVPSTDIEITGSLLVDADVITAGLKVIVNFHSSTGAHVFAKVLNEGRGFDVQVQLPMDKQEVVTAINDLVYFYAEKGQPEMHTPIKTDNIVKETSGCFDQAAEYLGLIVCGGISVPFTFSGPEAKASISEFITNYPLSGSVKMHLSLEKHNLRGYQIKGQFPSGGLGFELLFDAVGAKHGRTKLSGEYVNNQGEIRVSFSLDSAFKIINGKVAISRSPSEHVLLVNIIYDTKEVYLKIGFNVQRDFYRTIYKPVAIYRVPSDETNYNISMSGQVIMEVNNKTEYTIDNIKIIIFNENKPICIYGSVTTAGTKDIKFDVSIKDFATLKGLLKNNQVSAEFTNIPYPYINFRLRGFVEYDQVVGYEIDLLYGGDLRNNKNRVLFSQMYKNQRFSEKDFIFFIRNKFQINASPIKARFDVYIDPKKLDVVAEGQYIDMKAEFYLDARTQIKKPGDYSLKLKSTVYKNSIEVFSKRDIISADKSNFENYVDFKNIGKYELSGVVLHKTTTNNMNVGAIGHLKLSLGGNTQDIRFDVGAIKNLNLYSSHAKISNTQEEILDYLLKVVQNANYVGQLKLIIKNSISAHAQYKTDINGEGDGIVIVEFKKAQRKFKGDFKFLSKAPNYEADVDVYLNYEKDNNDKIHFSTITKRAEKLVDSKNKFDYNGKKFEVNVLQNGVYTAVGKTHGSVELVLPTERTLTFKVDRDITHNNNSYNGHAEVLVSDAVKRGGAASTFSYKGRILNTNIEKNTFNCDGQVELKLKGGKKLVSVYSTKGNPDGDKMKYEAKADVTGNVIEKFNLDVVYTTPDSLITRDDKYRIKAIYGDKIGFEWAGDWVSTFDKGDKKYLDDFVLTLRLPFEEAYDIKYIKTLLYLQPENKDTVEYTIVESVQVNADVYKIDANGKVGPQTGYGTVKLLIPHQDPVVLDVNYENDRKDDKLDNNVSLKAKYGKGKSANFGVTTSIAPRDNTFTIKAGLPSNEKLKKLEFTVHSKNPLPDTYVSKVLVDVNGSVYKANSTFIFSKAQPLIDVRYSSPSTTQPRRFYFKRISFNSTQGKVELKLENIDNLSLDMNIEANIQKDNVAIKVVGNSERLLLKNINLEIASKDTGNGTRLEFCVTNDNNKLLSGSMSYVVKQNDFKTIIEGSGALIKMDEQTPVGYKYVRVILGDAKERGVETYFGLAIGKHNYIIDSKVTNFVYKKSYLYCDGKKQCAHAELNSKIDVSTPGVITNAVSASFDLRKLGIAPEFGLQIKDEVSDKKLPQYTMDVHVNKEDKKYHLHIYNTPEFGNAKSGVTVQLPQRTLALESVVSYPTNKGLPFPIRGELSLDLDKTRQGHKTSARFLVDVDASNDKQQSAVAEFGFNHPRLNKEILVRIRGGVQHPAPNSIRLETLAAVSHPVIGADREAKILFERSPTNLKFFVSTPLVKVIDVEGSAVVNDKLQKGELRFSLLEGKSVQMSALAKEYQYFEFTTDKSDCKLSIVGHIQFEKRVDLTADIVLRGDKKNIFNGALFLDNDLVKSEYGASRENFNHFFVALQKDIDNLQARVVQLGEKGSNDVKALLKRVEPTLKKVQDAYTEDLTKLYQEIADDKALKEISHAFNEIVQQLAKIIEEVLKATKPLVDEVRRIYVQVTKKIQELYEKQIEPQLKHLKATANELLKDIVTIIIDYVSYIGALAQDLTHKLDLKELTNAISRIFMELTGQLMSQVRKFRARITQITADFSEQFKERPIFRILDKKEPWQSELAFSILIITSGLISKAEEVFLAPSEVIELDHALMRYIYKKLFQPDDNAQEELDEVYHNLATAVISFVQSICHHIHLGEFEVPTHPLGLPLFFSLGEFPSVPIYGRDASASPLSRLLRGDVPDVLAMIKSYRPKSLNLLDEVPAKLRAVVVNGQHIFTFDGRHLTFPGNCRYVLAHDHVDRNFTLLLQLVNGAPKALILEDKSGAVLELKDNGQATLNGANHGFPIIEKDSFAFRQANGHIGLGSVYGIMAFCSTKLEVCYIEVNGFYLGKLRGLLGDGNNEPYDDFRLPTEKISEYESEFGNWYRLFRHCPRVQVPEHCPHQLQADLPPACEQVFGGFSPLRPLSLFLDTAPFRQACVHAYSGNSTEALHQACDLARGYAALAVTSLLPAVLPDICVQCSDADKPRKVGETYEIKVPYKQADIIVVFETTVDNEKNYKNIVVPLVANVIARLKSKRCTNIKVYLVGITPKYPYPILYDTDLQLKNAKVQFDDKSRYLRHEIVPGNDPVLKAAAFVANLYDTIVYQLGITNVATSYGSIFDLPLRAGAVKHSIITVGQECASQLFLVEAARSAAYSALFDNLAYSHSIVAVTPQLKIGNGKNYQHVVGYTNRAVILLGDKRVGKEAENLRSTLETLPDTCRDFVEDTDGLVISATNFHNLNAGQQKQFIQTATAAINQRLFRETLVQECTCGYVDPFRVRSLCITKDKKEARRR